MGVFSSDKENASQIYEAAKYMVEAAEREGRLQPGSIVLESSSGNTGIALAMVCRIKGYTLKIVLPENVSIERRQLLEVFGAEIIPSPGAEGSNGAVRRAQALAEPRVRRAARDPPMRARRPTWRGLVEVVM